MPAQTALRKGKRLADRSRLQSSDKVSSATKKEVVIVDTGLCNLGSIKRALEVNDCRVLVALSPSEIKNASRLVIPGVGAFASAMERLNKSGMTDEIISAALGRKIPVLGVCLGMHLLARIGWEEGETEGLGLLGGSVMPLQPTSRQERVPHVGWNSVQVTNDSLLTKDLPLDADFYFVHSYHFVADTPDSIIGRTPYCGGFTSIINHENIYGTQFHPEKSQKNGKIILKNFLSL
ncbi:imidazole glycerol phosphate synthase subunit HisH [Aestuariispira ectoiniformans]|uniref:imidazole glycerol phosphate synthase subunit HisH n=1 Tax=Aestuariispira ectoiniformans TaxID=2775080 RepID=UPI00223C1F24|nr:imidazole glycerol phosphate synthase subunit HisH [Aestuariispira ectoiniformans]